MLAEAVAILIALVLGPHTVIILTVIVTGVTLALVLLTGARIT